MVASTWAMRFASQYMNVLFKKMIKDMETGNFELLDVCHHFSSGFKAVFTQECIGNLYTIRQCIGGAGFTAWSAIPKLIDDYTPNPTFEGDNTVMAQQCCNYLMKLAKKLEADQLLKVLPVFEYVRTREQFANRKCKA